MFVLKKHYKVILVILIIMLIVVLTGRTGKKEPKIYTDIEYVQSQFPKIKDIKSVRYYYYKTSRDWEIGLENIEFGGIIEIGDDFLEIILEEYKWKSTKKSKKITPKSILLDGEDTEYNFLFSYDFNYDGTYKTDSFVGYFYLDKEKRVLYFEGQYA